MDCRICKQYIPGCVEGAACKLETCIEKLFPIYLADLRELANEEGVIFEELFLCADNQEFVHAVLLEE